MNGVHTSEDIVHIPVLTTARLRLRGLQETDLDAYAAMLSDPDVVRFLGDGKPLNRADAWRQIAMILGHWTLRGFGLWAVEERATGKLIGRIGCYQPEGWPGFEIGYMLGRPFWGRGLAQEGARAALHYARSILHQTEIISIIRPTNVGSIRVATALGAVAAESVELFGAPADIYRYPRSEGAV
jgi:RimJ/RimL family protein N-acetyltransferase